MSPHDRPRPTGPDDPDPLAGFFAAERDRLRPLPADELRWHDITRRRRSRGGSWRGYAAAAAAVVVVGGGVGAVSTLRDRAGVPAAQPTVTQTVYVAASPTTPVGRPASSVTAPVPSLTTGPASPTGHRGSGGAPLTSTVVPADFRVLSLTTVASGRLFALGSATCGGERCALVATSVDGGSSWSVRGRLPGVSATPRLSAPASAPSVVVGSGSGVTDVRFADDTVGWVFGSTVLRTSDGGRSWAPYARGGSGPVLALETDGSHVALASASGCTPTVCTGAVTVAGAAVGADSAATVGSPLALGQAYLGLDLAWRQGSAVLTVRSGTQDPPATLVRDGVATALTSPGCPGDTVAVAAPADGSGLVAFCGPATVGGPLGPVLAGDGTAWTQLAPGGPVGVSPSPGGVLAAAAVDREHLVVVAGGAEAGADLAVSADGGRTWRTPTSPPTASGGFTWVGSPGGRTYYALPARPDRSFWRSDDAGQTWRAVTIG